MSNIEEKIQIIKQQTKYTIDEIKELLTKYNNNHMDVLRHAHGIKKKTERTRTEHEQLFKNFRDEHKEVMDQYYQRVKEGKAKNVI